MKRMVTGGINTKINIHYTVNKVNEKIIYLHILLKKIAVLDCFCYVQVKETKKLN